MTSRSARLGRDFFARDTVTVARELVGAEIVADGGAVVAELIEVEAYLGETDAASHAWRGPTPRSRIMFGPAGHLYVYLSYGIHCCANIVTEADGVAGAVLLRAAHVARGADTVSARRSASRSRSITERLLVGPGNLCAGLDIRLGDGGLDLCEPSARFQIQRAPVTPVVVCSRRIGISRNTEVEYRFCKKEEAPQGGL